MDRPHYLFVTGRLAEFALRETLAELAPKVGFVARVEVLNITVAALLTVDWVAKRLAGKDFAGIDKVILPGWCRGDLETVRRVVGPPVERGPKDVRELPAWFGAAGSGRPADYGAYDIEILAEINHAPRLSPAELAATAAALKADGADVIDLGCDPAYRWTDIGDAVRRLRDLGLRISVDTLDPLEIAPAAAAGAELVLSVNRTNREHAPDWGIEVVVVPDDPSTLAGLEETAEYLETKGVKYRLDPILEPLGFGFADSLNRYHEVRRRFPAAEMMMGIGNLTELTDVDSAGINVLLLGYCQELEIRSILTTQVINWAADSVAECDLARRLMHYAVRRRTLPKKLEPGLVRLRDPQVFRHGTERLAELARRIKDNNFRLFAEDGQLHVINGRMHLTGDDPFALFDEMQAAHGEPLTPGHAFYLGYELAKAVTALTLRKNYRQDQALEWGRLTRPETGHRGKKPRNGEEEPAG